MVDLYRGINDFKKVYQPRSNLVKDENGDLLADSHNILNKWKNYFSQLLHIFVHRILHSKIHKLIKSICNKEELPDQWKESIIVPVHKKGDKTAHSNYCGISLLSTSYKILSNILFSSLSPYINEIIGNHQYGLRPNRSTTEQIFAFVIYWKRNGNTMRQYISYS
jgi:hypothetical protein